MKIRSADLLLAPPALAMLACLALPAMSSLVSQDKDAACIQTLSSIWRQVDAYRSRHGSFPDRLELAAHCRSRSIRCEEMESEPHCPATHVPYRFPANDLNHPAGQAVAAPLFADPLVGVFRTPHGDARSVGANVLYRDGSVRKVTLQDTAAWRSMLVATRQDGRLPPLTAGDTWTFRTTENPDLRIALTVEKIGLEDSLSLAALVYKDSTGRERWRDVVYPIPEGWRFYKRSVEGRALLVKPSGERARRVAELIENLASDDPLERMGAAEKIAEMWFEARDVVEDAIARSSEPEVALKLRQALAIGIRNGGSMLLPAPLAVGAAWETPAGEGHALRHEVLDERFIVTALGETHCFQIRTDSPSQAVTTWFSPTFGPVVVQFVSKANGSKVEWRLESRKESPRRAIWMCHSCGNMLPNKEAVPGRPTCESCGVPMEQGPRPPKHASDEIEPSPAPVPPHYDW